MTTASTSSGTGVKISFFGAKSGFVIPKNKLSGSLIPIFQRGKKTLGGTDSELGKRKSKWGSDLTQDTAVKKCRLLAYQKRLDQITQQLESGTLESETNRESDLASLAHQDNSDIAENLELEKREVIGEILELNPRYKAPSDYKPLMKEATLPIHVDEHSDLSFLSLVFSFQGDTQKRLEKETGAKVQLFGTKTGGEKVELSHSDENEIKKSWKELYFQISSDTYEKVDAAIAVIELLISSVTGNTGAGDPPPSSKPEDISTISGTSNATATDPISEQLTDNSVQPPQSQVQQHGSSFPFASNQIPFYPPLNPSAPNLGNHFQNQELPSNSTNPNPLFSQQPFPIPHNTSLPPGPQVPRPPDLFPFSHLSTLRANSMVGPQGSLPQPGFSTRPPYSVSQIQPIGPHPTLRPSNLLPFQPRPSNVFRPTLLPDIASSNMAQSVRPLAPNFNQRLVTHQPPTELPSIPLSLLDLKNLIEYASGGSLRPMSAHIGGRAPGPVSTYPPTNTAPRPFHGDFSFLRQQQIPPRPNSQSAHLPHLGYQAPSITPASQHFGQNFGRSQHFDRQIDQVLSHLLPLSHGNVRPTNLQNFGPPLPQMRPRNFPGAQIPHHSTHIPQRPVFHHDNMNPRGQPQSHHRFNAGVHQVYDPFSPSDA